jgi:hypothetical protein
VCGTIKFKSGPTNLMILTFMTQVLFLTFLSLLSQTVSISLNFFVHSVVKKKWIKPPLKGVCKSCTFASLIRVGYQLVLFGGQSTENDWTTDATWILDTSKLFLPKKRTHYLQQYFQSQNESAHNYQQEEIHRKCKDNKYISFNSLFSFFVT